MGACPIMCLAPWSSLPRAAYVLTGRNTGKQLAASDLWYPSGTASKCQFPLHGQHPHFQMCVAGVKFKLPSGRLIHILVSYFVLKPSMCHWPHITFWKMPIRVSTGLPSSLPLHVKHELIQPYQCKAPYRSCYALEMYLCWYGSYEFPN